MHIFHHCTIPINILTMILYKSNLKLMLYNKIFKHWNEIWLSVKYKKGAMILNTNRKCKCALAQMRTEIAIFM